MGRILCPHALTGRLPFAGDMAYAIVSKQISTPVPVILAIVAHVPERFCKTLRELDKADREARKEAREAY